SLPPLNSLVAFEAAARHLSFTRAGEELLVSREAVSRQIRILEDYLGVKLFARLHRALALTEAGEALRSDVRQGLETIAQSVGAVRRTGARPKVTITATIALASFWLTPRLSRFRAAHPGTEIRVVVSDAPVDLAATGIDVGLRYGDGDWPGLTATRLFDIESFPVAAPGYLADHPSIAAPADLAGHTLLNLDGTSHAVEDWDWWLAGAGAPPPAAGDMLGFDSYANVIQAAVDGQGLALGFSGIIDGLLAAGDLIRPLETALSRGHAVYLVVPKTAPPTPNVKAFRDWVLAEAGARP
ncbi:MAG: LysR substrate-binding domain-containing protein, partial [Alphaproteobacteria bacterium]|nr:LysR substrate-binding domain-containing protein [Alphaproteobacteria bacterium]